MANLLEAYKNKLAIAEKHYSNTHNGATLSNRKKIAVAAVLNNTNKFMTEAFTNSVGTQRADLGEWKKFCLTLTTLALPNLIAHDLVIVHPMSSWSGYIAYVQYTAGSNKGDVKRGHVFNDPFRLGNAAPDYTADAVVENIEVVEAGQAQTVTPAWTPVILDTFPGGKAIKLMDTTTASGAVNVTYHDLVNGSFSVTPVAGHTYKFAYKYDNVVIPQNDLPIYNAEMKTIPLVAKVRRIAVYYSQIAAFQAKQDYGFNLGEQIAQQAVGELAYEIDTEIVNLLVNNAEEKAELKFNKALPLGLSKAEHYEGFAEVIEQAKAIVYSRTKRFMPNYILITPDILPMLTFIKGFKAANVAEANGPYMAGALNGVKVFVTPNIETPGTFVVGVNGDDFRSSAAVYAPYMAICPTQLLGYADGAMSQGWSTAYALELLNKDLLVRGSVINDAAAANEQVLKTDAQ